MKDNYRSMMENITLSPAARTFIEGRIEAAPVPEKHSRAVLHRRPLALIAASLTVVMLLFLVPGIAEALRPNNAANEFIERNNFTGKQLLYSSPEGYYEIFSYLDKNEKEHTTTMHDYLSGPSRPFWLKQEGDRLYFVGGDEKIDITDQFDEETPFMKVFSDGRVMYHVAVGGRFDPNDPKDSFLGYITFLRNDPNSDDPLPSYEDGWISGDGHNDVDPQTEICTAWMDAVLKEYDTPWNEHYYIVP